MWSDGSILPILVGVAVLAKLSIISLAVCLSLSWLVWCLAINTMVVILGFSPRCPGCGGKIIKIQFRLTVKFQCPCGAQGIISMGGLWFPKVKDWIPSNLNRRSLDVHPLNNT